MNDMNIPSAKGKTIKDYLASAAQVLMGRGEHQPQPESVAREGVQESAQVIDKKAIQKAAETLRQYKEGKRKLEDRIVEEEQWWKLRHWDVVGKGELGDKAQPTSAWLFNSISAKHADFMDNYPEPNVLPRERGDEESANILSSILPVIYERNNYEETYSDASWYKLKHGVAAKGVFWNTELGGRAWRCRHAVH